MKKAKYTDFIMVRLTHEQKRKIENEADRAHLEPSVYMRKIVLDKIK